MTLSRIEDALAELARGEMVIVVDDAGRENEGDLIMAAEKVTPEKLGFMNGILRFPGRRRATPTTSSSGPRCRWARGRLATT